MGSRIAREGIKLLNQNGVSSRRIGILGLTFKEDVPDIRNTRVIDIVHELQEFGLDVQVHDPFAEPAEVLHEYGLELVGLEQIEDCGLVALAVSHKQYVDRGWDLVGGLLDGGKGVVMDVKAKLDRHGKPDGVVLWLP